MHKIDSNILKSVSVYMWKSLSYVWLFATPWTVVLQAPLSWDFPDKNTGVGCHALLLPCPPTQGSNWSLLHLCGQVSSLPLCHLRRPHPIPSQPEENIYNIKFTILINLGCTSSIALSAFLLLCSLTTIYPRSLFTFLNWNFVSMK